MNNGFEGLNIIRGQKTSAADKPLSQRSFTRLAYFVPFPLAGILDVGVERDGGFLDVRPENDKIRTLRRNQFKRNSGNGILVIGPRSAKT